MQQQRLMRSRTEVVISGVCGGLGEYFGVDPVIVRLIFALATLTTGIGLLIYPALWIAMPKAQAGSAPGPQMFGVGEQPYVVQRERAGVASAARYAEPPPPSSYNFDPLTGEPVRPAGATGETTQLPYDPFPADPQQISYQAQPAPARSNKGRWVAFGLIAFGIMVLADQLHINIGFIFPLLMIGLGVYLLRKH